jgi:hypothetical protein
MDFLKNIMEKKITMGPNGAIGGVSFGPNKPTMPSASGDWYPHYSNKPNWGLGQSGTPGTHPGGGYTQSIDAWSPTPWPTSNSYGVGSNNNNGLSNIRQNGISGIQAPANNMHNWLAQLMKLLQGGRY